MLLDKNTNSRTIGTERLMHEGFRLLAGPVASSERPLTADFVEKIEKSSGTKTRQIAIRWNIAAQQHLRPAEHLASCAIDKLAGPPADFLNAAPIGLPANRTSPKASFSNTIGAPRPLPPNPGEGRFT